ncbi:hypothetical protein C7999DRAFT_30350 [Corynascus novoguineensis]|uniref:Uncharacterized protein n=1 Tax=Corynascus novoguineensis TaxID=1126955 RepID=A0AAN7HKQ1_9PEZI|nr:hypothetical protein C7999DRAFT_30350 [Corynascus novoguineensis]
MSSREEIVKFTGSENWKEWHARFITEAIDRRLWDIINPASPSRDRPTSAVNSAHNIPKPRIGPANSGEMTIAGREAYKIDLAEFHSEEARYREEFQNITSLRSWISKTVDAGLYDATYDPEKKLHQWYMKLKKCAGTNEVQEMCRAIGDWKTATEGLTLKPEDMLSWLRSWELALLKAQKANVPGTNDSKIWWIDFEYVVRDIGYEGWCESYYHSNQDAINGNMLTLQKLVNDFGERIRREDTYSRRRTIARGAFASFAKRTSDEED